MGKTEKGAVWLDAEKTSPYDFFQYWRNVNDPDVEKFFKLFTFLPLEEIDQICKGDINAAKERLAYEVTALIHSKEEADKALSGARAAFSGAGNKEHMPTVEIPKADFEAGIGIVDLFFKAIGGTKSDARRLVEQGGAVVAEKNIRDVKAVIGTDVLDSDGEVVIKAGKKKMFRVVTK